MRFSSGIVMKTIRGIPIDLSWFHCLVQPNRHAHRVAFEQSDLLFVCMLKPLSSEITIDEKEIEAAKVIEGFDFTNKTVVLSSDCAEASIVLRFSSGCLSMNS